MNKSQHAFLLCKRGKEMHLYVPQHSIPWKSHVRVLREAKTFGTLSSEGGCSQFLWELLVQLFWLQGPAPSGPPRLVAQRTLKLIRGSSGEVFWSWPIQLQIWCLFFLSSSLVFTNQETISQEAESPLPPSFCSNPLPVLQPQSCYPWVKPMKKISQCQSWNAHEEIIWFSLSCL